MTARQKYATRENPNHLELTEVACYRRTIKANATRVWENVKDWEHLPHLHHTNFQFAELDDAGDWGWRIWSSPDHSSQVELCYDLPNNRYVARSYVKDQQVSEIWTSVTPSKENTNIEVRFLVKGIAPEKALSTGEFFLKLYTTLWDEDEAMMIERQIQLDTQSDIHPLELDLGYEDELLASVPKTIDLKRGKFRIIAIDGVLKAHSAICPHNLGPLTSDISENKITCPWHGYQFDIKSGECLSPPQANCRLSKAPQITISNESRPRVRVGFTGG